MKTTDPPIVISQRFAVPAARVWRAISDHQEMLQWYFDNLPDFKAAVGFKTDFLIEHEGRRYHHRWTVTEVTPGERLTYEWVIDDYPGRSVTQWDLKEEAGVTTLTLDCRVLEDFPGDIPEFKRESGVEGWTYFINDRLKAFLEKPA